MPRSLPGRLWPTLGFVSLICLWAPLAAAEAEQVASIVAPIDDEVSLRSGEAAAETPYLMTRDIDEETHPEMAVIARIDLSDQQMHVFVDGELQHVWPVSTGRGSYRTPTGRWNAEWLSPRHRSRKYNNAPMPWSVFFYRGYAVHGTTELSRLGQPASHGCVRLDPKNAKVFFQLVKAHGLDASLVSIVQ